MEEIRMEKVSTRASGGARDEASVPHIVHVAAYFPPHVGGLERVALRAATHLADAGVAVSVITSTCGTEGTHAEEPTKFTLRRLWSFEFMLTPWAPMLFFELLFIKDPTVFHIHMPHAYWTDIARLVAWIRRTPYVAHFHIDVNISGRFRYLLWAYKKATWGPFLRGAARVITCSEAMAVRVTERYGVDPDRISVIPNAVDAGFFNDHTRSHDQVPLRLLSVGRITPQKRLDRLIDALALVSTPATLTIVGDGEERARLETLTRERMLKNIQFVGFKGDREMQQYHRESDIFLISSSHEGGTPLVALEAMAAGLPVIGSDGEGVRDVLQDVGIVVREPYAQGFAAAIDSLAKDSNRRKQLSEQSRTYAASHTWSAFTESLLKVYDAL